VLILVWGLAGDRPLARVRAEVERARAPFVFADQARVLDMSVRLEVGARVGGSLRLGEGRVDLGDVTAAYLRPHDSSRLPAVLREGPPAARRALAVDDALLAWSEVTPALVLNRPEAMAENGSKPLQLAHLAALGFRVPDTLVTTDPDAARRFWERHGTVVYKSVSSARSKVARLGTRHLGRLRDVAWCPTQFQQYVAGLDVRVHVIGDEVFAAAILSSADDYRYAAEQGCRAEVLPWRLPFGLDARCRELAQALCLPVAGIDLRWTPEGEWFCFEVNPSPAFAFYEAATGQPLAAAIAHLLMTAPGST
jgi:glutathione synthase/RimK-type ligase-like ATP-grasp enzyme